MSERKIADPSVITLTLDRMDRFEKNLEKIQESVNRLRVMFAIAIGILSGTGALNLIEFFSK